MQLESVPLGDFKKFQLGILEEFMRVCKRHNLAYYAAFGTLLGAVRHKGFIPWDDDIDIWMPGRDYLALREACEETLDDAYYFQSHGSNVCNFLSWQRIGVRDSTSLPKEYANIHGEWGVCIDIFPLIPYSSDPVKQRSIKKDIRALSKLSGKYLYAHEAERQPPMKRLYYRFMGGYPDSLNLYFWRKVQNRLLAPTDDEKSDLLLGSFFDVNISRPYNADSFKETILLPFEDYELPAPVGYEEVLSAQYGTTWREFPPESERVSHSGGGSDEVIVSLKTSYEAYLS